MIRTRKSVVMAALGLVVALAVGCTSRVNAENYARIRDGMTKSQVTAILGEGEVDRGLNASILGIPASGRVMKWDHGSKEIGVVFVDGKVASHWGKGL